MSSPAAGWYTDPGTGTGERWWDGTQWTDHRRATVQVAAPPAQTGPSAGWYDDPELVNTRRYWDGNAWTTHRQETQLHTTPADTTAKDDTAYAWTAALVPLGVVLVNVLSPTAVLSDWAFTIAGLIATLMVFLDWRKLTARHAPIGSWGWVLFYPGYLIVRTKRIGSTAAIPITYFAGIGLLLLTAYLLYALGYTA